MANGTLTEAIAKAMPVWSAGGAALPVELTEMILDHVVAGLDSAQPLLGTGGALARTCRGLYARFAPRLNAHADDELRSLFLLPSRRARDWPSPKAQVGFPVVAPICSLSQSKLTDSSVTLFFSAAPRILQLPRIHCLRLDHNNIGDDGMRSLSDAASVGKLDAVKELKLNSNRFTDDGLNALARALSQSPSGGERAMPLLNELHLGGNALSASGLQAFANVVCEGALPRLRELWLYAKDPGITEVRERFLACCGLARASVPPACQRAASLLASRRPCLKLGLRDLTLAQL